MKRTWVMSILGSMILSSVVVACGEDAASSNNEGVADAGAMLDSGNNTTTPNGSTGNNTEPNSSTPDMGVEDAATDSGSEPDMGDAGVVDMGDDAGADDAGGDAGMDDAGMADAGMQPTYDTCDGALDVTAGGTFTGSTLGQSDDYGPLRPRNGCPAGGIASGPDVVYSVSPTTDTTYDFVVTPDGATYDPMLYILTNCSNDDVCEAGTILNGPGVQESLLGFMASGGTTYYLVVDGELNSSGSFTLDVTLP